MPRIGLVLGGGGVIGSAYLSGALEAVRRMTGWTPELAEVIVGTSAGSFVGALSASGVPPWLLYYRMSDELPKDVDADAEALDAELRARRDEVEATYTGTAGPSRDSDADVGGRVERLYPASGMIPRLFLSSPAAVRRAVLMPWRTTPQLFLAGLLGEGFVSTEAIGDMVRMAVPRGWTDRQFWAATVDLENGRRVMYGHPDVPVSTDVHRAVRASCAIPGFFAPVRINGRRHVDGGVWSASNLDVLAGRGLDLALVVNPMSTLEGRSWEGPVDRITGIVHNIEARVRGGAGRRLGNEARKVEHSGTPVHIVQPTQADLSVMPVNLMDGRQRRAVAVRAVETTMRALETDASARPVLDILAKAAAEAGFA